MKNRIVAPLVIASASIIALACQPDRATVEPSLGRTLGGHAASNEASLAEPQAVVVNPDAHGNGVTATIQEAIERVADGGQVLVKPGTYPEALVMSKGLTLRPIGDDAEPVVIAPPDRPDIAIQVATREPVVIQGVTLLFSGANGIRGDGVVNVTVERVTALAVSPLVLSQQQNVISFSNSALTSGGRAQVTLRNNVLNGGVAGDDAGPPSPPFAQVFGISLRGDVTAEVAGNSIRQMGGACIIVTTRDDLNGETNVDIVDNDLDECYPLQRAGSLLVQPRAGVNGIVRATGVVNIVGNTIRNSRGSPLPTTGISQLFAPGRIERNRILGVVQPGAVGIATRNPAAIWIGTLSTTALAPNIAPIVRLNDIEGNAYAGLRVGPNITTSITATCNWWGTADGPSILTATNPQVRDAIVIEAGAAVPSYVPFAAAPIASTTALQCY